jgi:glycosyltransferase involved in cell wall biosynthesis
MIRLSIVGLYLGYGSFGGVINYIKLLMEYLDNDKFKTLYYSLGKSPNWYEGNDKPTQLEFIIKLFNKILLFFFFLKKNKIEIVHINSGLTWMSILREGILSKIAKFANCKTLFFIHGWKEKEYNKMLNNKLKKKIVINFLNKQDCIAVLAKEFKEKLVKLGIDKKKIFVTSTMVESKKYFPQKKLFLKPYNILICVNMIKEKGIFEFLDAAPNVIKLFSDSKFIFIGEGKELEEIKQKSIKMNLNENVEFKGYLVGKEKIDIFKNAHIFVMPSYTEGFPTVVLEAMAAGTSLVYTPVGGLVNSMVDGVNGYMIDSIPPNPKEISQRILKLLQNPNIMKKMSKNNLNESKVKYDADILSKKIGKIYEQILNNN